MLSDVHRTAHTRPPGQGKTEEAGREEAQSNDKNTSGDIIHSIGRRPVRLPKDWSPSEGPVPDRPFHRGGDGTCFNRGMAVVSPVPVPGPVPDESILTKSDASLLFSGARTAYTFTDEPVTDAQLRACLLYTSPSPRDQRGSRMPSSA